MMSPWGTRRGRSGCSEVSKKSIFAAVVLGDVLQVGVGLDDGAVMVGSSSGSSAKVLAKQPFSVAYTLPPGISATKSSCTGCELFCRVNVVVVLPVPESPTISPTFSWPFTGMTLQPACSARPPRLVDDLVPHPQPALLRLTEVVGVEHARDLTLQINSDQAVVRITRRFRFGVLITVSLWLRRQVIRVIEELLHAGHVGVRLFHDQPGRYPELRVVADPAIDDEHVLIGDVCILQRRDPRPPLW